MSFADSVAYEISIGLRCTVCEKEFRRDDRPRYSDSDSTTRTHPGGCKPSRRVAALVEDVARALDVKAGLADGPCDCDGRAHEEGIPHPGIACGARREASPVRTAGPGR